MITLAEVITRGESEFSAEHVLEDFHFTRTDRPDASLVLPFNHNPSVDKYASHSNRMAQKVFACALQEVVGVLEYVDTDDFIADMYGSNFMDTMTAGEYRAALRTFRALQEVAEEMSFFIGAGNPSLFNRLCEADEEVRNRYVTLFVRGAP